MLTDRRYQLLVIGFEHYNLRNTFIKHMVNKFEYRSAVGSINRMLRSTYMNVIIEPTNKVLDSSSNHAIKTVVDRDHLCAALVLDHDALIQFLSDMNATVIDMGPIDE